MTEDEDVETKVTFIYISDYKDSYMLQKTLMNISLQKMIMRNLMLKI